MPYNFRDRVYEVSTSIGLGPFELDGIPAVGYQSFYDTFGSGGTQVHYEVAHRTKSEWEIGYGHLTVSVGGVVSLHRDTVLRSSLGGAAVSFTSGVKDCRTPWPVSQVMLLNDKLSASGNLAEITDQAAARANLGIVFPGLVPVPTVPLPWDDNVAVGQHELRTVDINGSRLLLQSKTARTTGSLLDVAEYGNWILLSQHAINPFLPAAVYAEGFEIIESGSTYRRIVAGIGGAAFDTPEQANWQLLSPTVPAAAPSLALWAPTTLVAINELRRMTVGGVSVAMRSLSNRTTAATLSAIEYGNWEYVSQSLYGLFVPAIVVPLGYTILNGSQLWVRKTAAGTTAAFFSGSEKTKWQATSPTVAPVGTGPSQIAVAQTAHGLVLGDAVYLDSTGVYGKANAHRTALVNRTRAIGVVSPVDADNFIVVIGGELDILSRMPGTPNPGDEVWLSTVDGLLSLSKPDESTIPDSDAMQVIRIGWCSSGTILRLSLSDGLLLTGTLGASPPLKVLEVTMAGLLARPFPGEENELLLVSGRGNVRWSDTSTNGIRVTASPAAVPVTTAFATSTSLLNAVAHGFVADDRVFLRNTFYDLPNGLAEDVPYYVVAATANQFSLSASSGGAAETFTDNGTGVTSAYLAGAYLPLDQDEDSATLSGTIPVTANDWGATLRVDCTSGVVTINLPKFSRVSDRFFFFVEDKTGRAAVNNITINQTAGDKFNSTTSPFVIAQGYSLVRIWRTDTANEGWNAKVITGSAD